jgi:hypothetical protein
MPGGLYSGRKHIDDRTTILAIGMLDVARDESPAANVRISYTDKNTIPGLIPPLVQHDFNLYKGDVRQI